jgi:hypothetical protein
MMLYIDLTEVETCSACGRRWVDLNGIREPVEDDDTEFRQEDEDEGCLLCGGEW